MHVKKIATDSARNAYFGYAVANAGDLNLDGYQGKNLNKALTNLVAAQSY